MADSSNPDEIASVSGNQVDTSVVIYEDWNERDGRIYFRWRADGETEWHEKLTPYKQKPFVEWKLLSQEQVNDLQSSDQEAKNG